MMRDIEGALRGAMADEVADVSLPAGMAGRVRAQHRRHRRIRLTAALAGLAAIVVAVPLVTDAVLRDTATPPPADAPVVDEVDGVALTYLPGDLERSQVDGWSSGPPGWTEVTGRWRPVGTTPDDEPYWDHGIRLTVFRGEGVDDLNELVSTVWVGQGAAPRERFGRAVGRLPQRAGEWIDVYWRPEPGVALRLRVSDDLEPEIRAIRDGIRVGAGDGLPAGAPSTSRDGLCGLLTRMGYWPSEGSEAARSGQEAIEGLAVGVVPDGLTRGVFHSEEDFGQWGINRPGTWVYGYQWFAADDASIYLSVVVTCGELARDLDNFHRYSHRHDDYDEPRPYPEVGASPTTTALSADGGQAVYWQPHPGIVLEVAVGRVFVAGLDEIIAGIEPHLPDDAVDDATDRATACPPSDVHPAALPWLAEGEPMPEPEQEPLPIRWADEPGTGLVWWSDADPDEESLDVPYVSIVRVREPDREPGERFGFDREVRGHPAESVWVGDPGNSVIHVSWREADGACGVYRLSVNSRGIAPMLGEQWAEGGRCAAGGDPVDDQCFEEFHRAFGDELARILDSLAATS
jgi:hypothetical protein